MKEKCIAVYLRLSLEDVDKRTDSVKDDSNSIVSQRLLINRWLDLNPELSKLKRLEFCDDGFTGTNFSRPGFTKMLELAKSGEIGCVAVKDLSRFGRDYLEVGDYLEHIFPFLGIRFVSVNDGYDSEKHRGRTLGMDVAFRNLIYDYYSKDLSKKVTSAMRMKQKECEYVSCPPYGYKVSPENKHRLVIDEPAAAVVRRIYRDIIDGKSSTEVAKALNEERIPTPSEYKKLTVHRNKAPQWTHTLILGMIENIKYTGTMVNHTRESRHIRDKCQRKTDRSEWYIKENAHPPIISKEEYDAALGAIRRRQKSTYNSHDLTDRVYFCAHCGAKLEKANGTVFACPSHRYHDSSPCENVRRRKTELEEIIFEALKKQVQLIRIERTRKAQKEQSKLGETVAKLSALKKQIEVIDSEKFNLYGQYREGSMTAEEYLAAKETLTKKQADIKEQLAECERQLEQMNAQSATAERQEEVNRFCGLSDEQLKEHLYDAVEKVLVYDAKSIEIIWKFHDMTVVSAATV